jgi:zinc protease
LAQLTAELLTQGAGPRDARAFSQAVDRAGGWLGVFAGKEHLTLSAEFLSADLALMLELSSDALLRPAFREEDVARKRGEQLGRLKAMLGEPRELANHLLEGFVYGAHPYGHDTLGLASAVEATTREDVVRYHRANVRPEGGVLVLIGDVEPEPALAALKSAFGGWEAAGPRPEPIPEVKPAGGPARLRLIGRPELTQAFLRLSCPGPVRSHPDYAALQVANTILGGGFTSRLVDEIRVNLGLTYGIGSGFSMHRRGGALVISTFTQNTSVKACVQRIRELVRELVRKGPTAAELEKARRYLVGQTVIELQDPGTLAGELIDVEFYGLEPRSIERFPERVRAVGAADVRRVLERNFCTQGLDLLVVGNPEAILPQLKELGQVETVAP